MYVWCHHTCAERGGAHLQRRRTRPTCSGCVALLLVVETPAHILKQLPGRHCWCQPGSIPGKSGLQPVTSFWSAALFASRLLVQCIKAVHFGHVSPPPRAHILCTGVRVSSENREPHALHVNTGGAAGPFSCWFETIGCGGLGGTFKIPTCLVFRLLVLGPNLHVLLRATSPHGSQQRRPQVVAQRRLQPRRLSRTRALSFSRRGQ